MTGSRDPRGDDKGRQRGEAGPLTPVSAVGAAIAAAWGAALGFASALLGSGRRAEEPGGREAGPAAVRPAPEPPQSRPPAASPTAPLTDAEAPAGHEPMTPSAAAPERAAEARQAPAAAGPQRPARLDRPRGGKADDLKQITGIGPKLEKELNKVGIHHYDQIAGWTAGHIAWIDKELKTRGRVQRDDWVAQAKTLMAGAKRKT